MKIQCVTRLFPRRWIIAALIVLLVIAGGCGDAPALSVPHTSAWGIYELDLETQAVRLVYASPTEMQASALRIDPGGAWLLFSAISPDTGKLDIYTIGTDGEGFSRLTWSPFDDLYPVWSPDGSAMAFLSQRLTDLDIYVKSMTDGYEEPLFDSGYHDADIDWGGHTIAFTSQWAIWIVQDDGTGPVMVTDPPDRGVWGEANLPAGDYDPRFSPDGDRIVFERLENTEMPNGGYNFFVINTDGSGEVRLTDNYYSQGLANWSHSGESLVYVVAAVNGAGRYDIWMMNADGTNNRDITPGYFPAGFLCHAPVFSADDAGVYFIGQWWE